MSLKKYPENIITVDGVSIPYHRINNDVNGNPRYVVHFLSLDVELEDYGRIPGLTKYRAKWFGGGYVLQTYDLESELRWAKEHVKEFYRKKKQKQAQTV